VTTPKKKLWPVSRRAFLGGLGAVGFSHVLPSGRLAHAQTGTPKRFVAIYVPEGMWAGVQRPNATTFGPVFGPMDKQRAKIVAFDGFNLASAIADKPGVDNHHRLPHLLGCTKMVNGVTGGGPTLDQRIAKVVGANSTFESLQFGVQIIYTDGSGRLIWKAAGEQLPGMQDPYMAYSRIFGGGMAPAPGPMPGPVTPGQPAPFDLRKSALDYSLGEIAGVQSRLGAADKMRVDSYQSSLRDIEKRLAGMAGGGGGGGVQPGPSAGTGSCAKPTMGAPIDLKNKNNFPAIAKLQMDLMVASFQCGATNVATLQFGNSVDQCNYPWLGVNRSGHDLSHGGSRDGQTKVYNWYSQQFVYLMDELQKRPEGAGTMLDNTVIIWVSEFGNSSSHSMSNLMWFMGGNLGGFFKTGQIIQNPGRSISDIHLSIAKGFGLPDEKFGDPAYCSGPVPGLIA
jgi:hypothetical protein